MSYVYPLVQWCSPKRTTSRKLSYFDRPTKRIICCIFLAENFTGTGAYKDWPEIIFLPKWTGQDRTGDTFLVIYRTGQHFYRTAHRTRSRRLSAILKNSNFPGANACEGFIKQLLPAYMQFTNSEDDNIRNNATYGIGVLINTGGPTGVQLIQEAMKALPINENKNKQIMVSLANIYTGDTWGRFFRLTQKFCNFLFG